MLEEIMRKVEEDNPKKKKLSDSVHDEDELAFYPNDFPFGMDVCAVCFMDELKDVRTKPVVVDPNIRELITSIKENRKKYPLPKGFQNWSGGEYEGNCVLRLDDICDNVQLFIPPAMNSLVSGLGVHPLGSKKCSFAHFHCHEFAKRFLNEFNGLQITGTNYCFKLSWAPFVRNYDCEHTAYREHPNNITETETELDQKILEERLAEYEAFNSFYISVDKRNHEKGHGPWEWPKPEQPKYLPDDDDGTTTTLCISMVDPIITKDHMMRVFDSYGDCSIELPSGKGHGFVTFVKRADAENAFNHLESVFQTFGICFLGWGIEEEKDPDDWYAKDVPLATRCHVLGNRCEQLAMHEPDDIVW